MASMCQTARDAFPGMYVACASVADGLASILTPLADQVEELAQLVRSDARLAAGFHAVGLSQGGLVVRGYIERHNDPPVRRFISVCSPHAGIGQCPESPLYRLVCPLWKLAPYTAPLAFADYWKDPTDEATYLKSSRWLADMNNERTEKVQSYREGMLRLERYVMVEALNDSMVRPHVSESHGFYSFHPPHAALSLRQTEGYRGDWLGLKTLDESGRLVWLSYEGDHLTFSDEWWAATVLPHLAPT
jgi:palmitoyl-protein thioesterase